MKNTAFCLRALLAFSLLPFSGGLLRAQSWQWAVGAQTGGGGRSNATATAVDAAGNTIVAGSFSGTLTLGSFILTSAGSDDIYVARFDPAGGAIQAVRAGGSDYDYVTGVVVDAGGTVTVVGEFNSPTIAFGPNTLTNANPTVGNSSTADVFVARLNSTGTWVQALAAGGPSSDYANAVALDGSGNPVVAGTFRNAAAFGATTLSSAGGDDIFVGRVNPNGTWGTVTPAGGSDRDYPSRLAVEASGGVVVAGIFGSQTIAFGLSVLANNGVVGFSNEIFVARLAPAGTWTSAVRAGGPDTELVSGLALSASNEAVVYGRYSGTATFGALALTSTAGGGSLDIFVARLSNANIWTQAISGGGDGTEFPTAFALDADGTATVGGYFYGPATVFGSITLLNANPSPGPPMPARTADGFLARLSPAGTWTQALRIGGPADDAIGGLAAAGAGRVSVVGQFNSPTIAFDGVVLSNSGSTGNGAAFVARLAGLTLATHAALSAEVFTLAPNPATATVRLVWPEASAAVRAVLVFDALGREVRRQQLPARSTAATLDVVGLTPGIYLVRCGPATQLLQVE